MKLKFLGATENVTGSRFLVETENCKVLIDCGLFQERELKIRNWENFPIPPKEINCVILTHAHLDHCGYLPKFLREGFKGKILSTPPTAEIAQIVLLDAAKLQEEDAEFKKKRHHKEGRKGPYSEIPLYTIEEAKKVFPYFSPIEYKKQFQINSSIKVTFYDAGHILGAGMIEMIIKENGGEKKIIFSGDIGRWKSPILSNPTVFENADYVIIESTYGNRIHDIQEKNKEKLERIIVETKKAGGNIVIPTFAIERAQELLYYLSRLFKENKIADILVFFDSPMAINVTEIFKKYPDYFDEETNEIIKKGESPFDFPLLKITKSSSESKKINEVKETSIIIAGSGMCTGGRIKHHLVHNITRPESTIVFVSYQAKGTLGREILERPKQVRILGEVYPVYARIEKINGFSAHADKNELLKWLSYFNKKILKKIFIVHGEPEAETELSTLIEQQFTTEVIIPKYQEEYVI